MPNHVQDITDPDSTLLFPGCTGRGVRVAVIDSGVHPDHPHIDPTRLLPGAFVLASGEIEDEPDSTLDRLGHGTAVTAAILEKATDAQCIPIRVFREGLRASAAALVSAIGWAVEQRVDLINLSLGATNPAHAGVFAMAVAEARVAGIAIIAAREANGVPCLPGYLDGVIGVDLDWDCPRAGIRLTSDGILCASGYPRAIPGVPHRRNLYGISFAVAQVTGFAALACEDIPAGLGRNAALPSLLAERADAYSELCPSVQR